MSSQEPTDRVIVVGAGFSGLTAARMLQAHGIETIILEGRDRLGGRAHTIDLDGASVDTGCSWIHGPSGNPVTRLLKAHGIDHTPDRRKFPLTIDSDGRPVSRLALLRNSITMYRGLLKSRARVQKGDGDIPVSDGFADWLNNKRLRENRARLVRFLADVLIELNYSGPIGNTSLRWLNTEEELSGGDHVPDGGYTRLVNHLAEGLDIRLSERVARISHDDHGVSVDTENGGEYTGSHVIVSVPLGVLKSGAIDFAPALPDEKRASIDHLDMGNLEKVILRFDDVIWNSFAGRTGLYMDNNEPGNFPSFVDATHFAGAPTLVCLYGGGFSRNAQDTMTDERLVAGALKALSVLLGKEAPAPKSSHATRWRHDPFSQGSYSYIPVGASPDDMHELAKPVDGRVFFAGEATCYDYFGTVHGAILSGIREAERFGAKKTLLPGF